ncbi:sulfurtransferase [Marinicauda salina]|jgi:rhodanese-related sulfurtransferase|uniref:Sulfurtransferase n=1 Tax=Marinicauda salina TaxID=2135793 RepID=A0A2U2BVB3_9PROT|nr:rhodanese-like domain-containing protein [Marinicauda salina]PWE17919.1 sulfurtransferase [Marinicauda salina]
MTSLIELTPEEVAEGLAAGEILLIDVREPYEFACERIPGAFLYPLSTFEPAAMPAGDGRRVVLSCCAGRRSFMAAQLCHAAGMPVNTHLEGGLKAWKAAGLKTVRIDPASGRVMAD